MLQGNARILKKYRGLDPDTPVPEYSHFLKGPRWDIWEWWAGSAKVSRCFGKLRKILGREPRVGPPISYNTGWDLRNVRHQRALREIQEARRPAVLIAEPQCSLWSNSNTTMDPSLKESLRQSEAGAHTFLSSHLTCNISMVMMASLSNPEHLKC